MKFYSGKGFLGLVLRLQAPSVLREHLKAISVVAVACVAALVGVIPASAATAEMQLSSTAINFGSTYVTLFKSTNLTIKNSGSADLVISKATASGPFTHGTMDLPRTIEPGDSISVTLWFHPVSVGKATGTLSISSNASTTAATVALSGTGLAQTMSLTPSSVNFASVNVGSTATQTETLKNTGTTSLDVYKTSVSASVFTLSGLSLPSLLAPGKSISFTLKFAPQSAGTISGSASISTSMEGSLTASLTGTGVAATTTRTLVANPTSLAFGSIDIGSTATKSVSVENTGNSSVSVSGVTMSGSGYAATGISSNETLAAGTTTPITVVFAPTAAASSSGDIQISSNASNSPLTIALSGTGVQTTQNSVALSWTASTSSVAGYNIYRSTVSGGPYTTLLNSSLVTGTTFTDTNVQAGTTYYYVVVAVNSNGVESSDSNQASATVP